MRGKKSKNSNAGRGVKTRATSRQQRVTVGQKASPNDKSLATGHYPLHGHSIRVEYGIIKT